MVYSEIPFLKFSIGAIIVATPLLFLKDNSWKGFYILLIILAFTMYNRNGVARFANFLTSVVR